MQEVIKNVHIKSVNGTTIQFKTGYLRIQQFNK